MQDILFTITTLGFLGLLAWEAYLDHKEKRGGETDE